MEGFQKLLINLKHVHPFRYFQGYNLSKLWRFHLSALYQHIFNGNFDTCSELPSSPHNSSCRSVCVSCVQDIIKVKFHVPFWTFNLGIQKKIHHYRMLGCKCQITEASLARAYSCQLKITSAILHLPQMFSWLNNDDLKAHILRQKKLLIFRKY